MARKLIIVESPAKAKTIKKYFPEIDVYASLGHIWDLPQKRFGVDVTNWKIEYEFLPGKQGVWGKIKRAAERYDEIYIASDPDREGEAIAFQIRNHLYRLYKDKKYYRLRLKAITKEEILKVMNEGSKDFDLNLFQAQQARRVLDRVVGFTLSERLNKNFRVKMLSAGRVQSATLYLVYLREKEIALFKSKKYYLIYGNFASVKQAILYKINNEKKTIENEEEAKRICVEAINLEYKVKKTPEENVHIHPQPPFTTSTLQQECFRVYKMSVDECMKNAQELYEGVEIEGLSVGLITYMRTDSVRVSQEKIFEAREKIKEMWGEEYVPSTPRIYKNKDNSQDAHEAIRPTHLEYVPEKIEKYLTPQQYKVYSIIYYRFLASQASDKVEKVQTVFFENIKYIFEKKFIKTIFDGFERIIDKFLVKNTQDKKDDEEEEEGENIEFSECQISDGLILKPDKVYYQAKDTKPPTRYTQGTLVKAMEKEGIGRPSTYAVTIKALLKRKYIFIKDNKIYLSIPLGKNVMEWLGLNYMKYVSTDFTSKMEEWLDKVAYAKSENEFLQIKNIIYNIYKELHG